MKSFRCRNTDHNRDGFVDYRIGRRELREILEPGDDVMLDADEVSKSSPYVRVRELIPELVSPQGGV